MIESNKTNEILPDFSKQINAVFHLFGGVGKSMEDDEFLEHLVKNGTDLIAVKEIIIFLPIAFVRCLLTDVNWPKSYIENTVKYGLVEKKYSETESYQIILKVTKEYFINSPDSDIVLNIAGRSAEFRNLNQLMQDNPEAKIKDAIFTKTIINRYE